MHTFSKNYYHPNIVWASGKAEPSKVELFFVYLLLIDAVLLFVAAGKIPFQYSNASVATRMGQGQEAPVYTPATNALIHNLEKLGLFTEPAGTIQRKYISPEGLVLTVYGDNIQVFEYANSATANSEADSFALRYASTTRPTSWKKQVSLFYKDKTLVYYFGTNESILGSLEAVFGPSIAQR